MVSSDTVRSLNFVAVQQTTRVPRQDQRTLLHLLRGEQVFHAGNYLIPPEDGSNLKDRRRNCAAGERGAQRLGQLAQLYAALLCYASCRLLQRRRAEVAACDNALQPLIQQLQRRRRQD